MLKWIQCPKKSMEQSNYAYFITQTYVSNKISSKINRNKTFFLSLLKEKITQNKQIQMNKTFLLSLSR